MGLKNALWFIKEELEIGQPKQERKMTFLDITEKIFIFFCVLVTLGYALSKYFSEGYILADIGLVLITILTIIEVFYLVIHKMRSRKA